MQQRDVRKSKRTQERLREYDNTRDLMRAGEKAEASDRNKERVNKRWRVIRRKHGAVAGPTNTIWKNKRDLQRENQKTTLANAAANTRLP